MLSKAFRLALFLGLTACGAGGGGCGGCGGAPLPDGFPREERITSSGTVRVTRSGLDFLAANGGTIAGGLLAGDAGAGGNATFEIPKSTQSGTADAGTPLPGFPLTVDYTINICPDGPKPTATPPECTVEIDLPKSKFQIDALTPNVLRVRGDVPIRLKDLPLHVTTSVGATVDGAVGVGKVGNPSCSGTPAVNPVVDWKVFPIAMEFPIVAEKLEPRDGYAKIDVEAAKIDIKLSEDDIAICATCGVLLDSLGVCNSLISAAKANAMQAFGGGALGDQIKSQLKTAFCIKPNPALTPSCPKGTLDKNGSCVFATNPNVCATSLLGTEGRLDLSSMLAGFGAEGSLDYLLGAAGPMNPAPGAAADDAGYPGHTPNGMTLTLFGGAKAVTLSKCVPPVTLEKPQGIPVPDELYANSITPWPANTKGPDLGVALAGRYLNFALANVYASGGLCIGATTEDMDQLRSGLLSIVIPSLKNLTFEQKGAAMAIATRPQTPPRIQLGSGAELASDPLLRLKLDKFVIDFYVYSLDRFVRVITFTADLAIPINLQTAKDPQKNPNGGIVPVLGEIAVANAEATGTTLLLEDPAKISGALTTIVGGLTNQLGGTITPIDLSGALAGSGIAVSIPEGGIRKISKGEDAFLGVFANFEVGQAASVEADARARIVERRIDKNAMSLSTLSRATRPTLRVELGSSFDGAREVEYSWAIDRGARSPWSREHSPTIVSDQLAIQGRHVLAVWARAVGLPRTEDTTPAEVPFVIDALPPDIEAIEKTPGRVEVRARDYVSDEASLRGRVRPIFGAREGEFGPLVPLAAIANIETKDATAVDVEVVDEDDNVGRVRLELIRGRGDPTLANTGPSACSCRTAGGPSPIGTAGPVALLLIGAAFAARRIRRGARLTQAPVLASCALAGVLAVTPGCSCGSDDPAPAKCGHDCKQECGPALPFGMIGAYTSVAKAKSGKIMVAGYADATLDEIATGLYGDLVVGEWDPAKGAVAWETVDGVPPRTEGCPTNDRRGFRGGETDPGDDVGLWTSIMIGEGDVPMVAYHDATHRSLKFAYKTQKGWQSYVVFEKAKTDAGRYAKLVMLENRPAIVFLLVEPGSGGKQTSHIVLAKANAAVPDAIGKWALQDIYVDNETPCWPGTCATGESCVKGSRTCTKTIAGCTPDCTTGTACVADGGASTCVDVNVDPQVITVPDTIGAYISAAVGPFGLGVVTYDRPRGNLVAFVPQEDGAFGKYVLDGETGSRADGTAKDTGDVGLGASLAIGADGDWHVAYVDGSREALIHLTARLGMTVVGRDVVDDGYGVNGVPFTDGKHIVGDDAAIRIDDGNAITICYQDSSAGELRCASGGPGRAFAVRTVPQPGKVAGFFPRFVPGTREVANHWRALDRAAQAYSGNVSIMAPP